MDVLLRPACDGIQLIDKDGQTKLGVFALSIEIGLPCLQIDSVA
jgi:hypothetical protein